MSGAASEIFFFFSLEIRVDVDGDPVDVSVATSTGCGEKKNFSRAREFIVNFFFLPAATSICKWL